jgi:hypothetical protein
MSAELSRNYGTLEVGDEDLKSQNVEDTEDEVLDMNWWPPATSDSDTFLSTWSTAIVRPSHVILQDQHDFKVRTCAYIEIASRGHVPQCNVRNSESSY